MPNQTPQMATAIEQCEQQTQRMMQQCNEIHSLILASSQGTASNKKHKRSEEIDGSPIPKKSRKSPEAENLAKTTSPEPPIIQRHPVTTDPSGLFVIDSNPADLEILVEQSEKRSKKLKRKFAAEDKQEEGAEGSARTVLLPKSKRAKRAEAAQEPVEHPEQAPISNSSKHTESGPETAEGNFENQDQVQDDHDHEFERKVALRLKEKEEASKSKANKKRKRESNVSVQESEAADEIKFEIEAVEPPSKKKQKGKANADQEEASPATAKSPKGIKRKKAKEKKAAQPSDTSASQSKPKRKRQKKSK